MTPRPAPAAQTPAAHRGTGALIRRTRIARGMTLAQLGSLTGYSGAQVSRYERGICPLTDVTTLRTFAEALDLPHHTLGVTPAEQAPARPDTPHRTAPGVPRPTVEASAVPPASVHTPGRTAAPGDDTDAGGPMRRRELLASLAVTAATATGATRPTAGTASVPFTGSADTAAVLVAGLRDAILGLPDSAPTGRGAPARPLHTELTHALADFHNSHLAGLATRLPALLRTGHMTDESPAQQALHAHSWLLTTRILIKLDEEQLAWVAVDRARHLGATDPLLAAEAARQLAVLTRRSGWHDQAQTLALSAADQPQLRTDDPALVTARGLLIQSAAYSAAKRGDTATMRDLTDEAAALAAHLPAPTTLRAHGSFTPATVALHRVSAENSAGNPTAALTAARRIDPAALPTTERRARYWTATATALANTGDRNACLHALLTAERLAPEETRARPVVRTLITGLLVSGRTTGELRGLAARTGTLG